MTKKKISFFLIFLAILMLLNIIYNKNILNLKKGLNYNIIDYHKSAKIFSDRDYTDNSKSNYFLKKKLIQVPRHHKSNLLIFSKSSITVYRPICEKNDNTKLYNGWKNLDLKLNIKGFSCIHKKIYYKYFDSFFFILKSGGPVSADPVFFELEEDAFFLVLNKKI